MQNIDRSIHPEYKSIEKVDIVKAEEIRFKNDTPVYVINAGSQDVIRIDFHFSAGSWYQDAALVSASTVKMLNEGTKLLTSAQIAEKIDYYGAHLFLNIDKHTATVSLYTINKHLEKMLPIVEDVIKNSIFPEKEFETYNQNQKQKFLINNTKVNTLVTREFSKALYGSNHPYGFAAELKDFDKLNREQLFSFYQRLYCANNCNIVVSGKVEDKELKLIEKHFGGDDWKKDLSLKENKAIINTSSETLHIVNKDDAVQSALRVGKVLFNKTHEDYLGMYLLNKILGGYFGSRLMTNIREDKGYTYGIGSAIVSFKNSGFFLVASEVGADVSKKAVIEIFNEIDKLRNEYVGENELNRVKNYIFGEMLRVFDGPFALADRFWDIKEYGLGYEYFDKFFNTIKNITSEDLNSLANKYLKKESLIITVAGKYQ